MNAPGPIKARGNRRVVNVREVDARLKSRVLGVFDMGFWFNPIVRAILIIGATVLFGIAVTTPLDVWQQALFSVVMFASALVLRRVAGQFAVVSLIVLSVTASMRYMYWRLTSTVDFVNPLDMVLGWGLVLAEIYALVVLLLGFLQTAWPLKRKPVPMPADSSTWPTIDILIPTYNEPLNIVKLTVFAALASDWPADKLKVYVLDDGRRPEFKAFCQDVGAGYITRDNNLHAKAGNLNWALARTSGEFVAIFDCDHVPTRSFLQLCMGWFLRDKKLAMLQTPHFFFSPDPFEKNLGTFRSVPNEGELFYGLVQDGNDLWNATFFCGSCAIMRRGPLLEVGGVAIETVTEDAHTALKMSRAGYNTAYLGIPQAAGLATESLSAHIVQRIRWARGMAQIFRVDNPIFGKGLALGQRLCYANAMLHFFYGLPRLVFLTAPLAYLIFGAQIFQAQAWMIVVYALPHIFHSSLANSTIQGRFRHSFWNEVYETVLAWYIMRPVTLALINPKAGAFNVTAKGGVIDRAFFDWTMARPYLFILLLNLVGMCFGLFNFIGGDPEARTTIVVNLVWATYNVLIACASVAVAAESRQLRTTPRVSASLPATVMLPNGKSIVCRTTDFSQQGLGIALPPGITIPTDQEIQVAIFRGEEEGVFPATIVYSKGQTLGLRLDNLDLQQQSKLAQITFGRADTWAESWGQASVDTPLGALREVGIIGIRGMKMLTRNLFDVSRTRISTSLANRSSVSKR